jgi:hypothetical protein
MKTLTANDIQKMVSSIQEDLKVTVGKGKKQKILISQGFKIMHLKSGLTYTVDSVKIEAGKPVIVAHSGDGEPIEIHSKDFKQYKGL